MTTSKMDCYGQTDAGLKRAENEDHFLVADLLKAVRIQETSLTYEHQAEISGQSHGKVLLVADGMGGHAAGRRASTLAVDETIQYMVNRMRWHALNRRGDDDDRIALDADLVSAVKFCQNRIANEAEWDPAKRDMGTTLTIALVDWPNVHVVHAGDSRCYRHRDIQLCQLTRDHTLAQMLVESGEITAEAAEDSPLNHHLWNVVGGPNDQLEPEMRSLKIAVGDTLLLCTDGLTKHVTDEKIADVLARDAPAEEMCLELVDRAKAAGGSDNVTVIIARFVDADENLGHTAAGDAMVALTADALPRAGLPKLPPLDSSVNTTQEVACRHA